MWSSIWKSWAVRTRVMALTEQISWEKEKLGEVLKTAENKLPLKIVLQVYELWSKYNRYFQFFQKVLQVNTFMPAFFPILETLLKRAFWCRQQLQFRFFFYLLNRWKTDWFVYGINVIAIHPWFVTENALFSSMSSVLGRGKKLADAKSIEFFGWAQTYKHRCASQCVIIVHNPWLVFPQFCKSLKNCFAQSAHNFKVILLIGRTTL